MPPAAAETAEGMARTIYEGLRDEITTGVLAPGTPLSRRQIAQRYGASYSPVIEAMVRLESVGLVEAERSQMARVREVTLESIESDHTLREALETQAIRLACENATPREIAELRDLAEQVEEAFRGDHEHGAQLDWQFHERIAEISRSPALVGEIRRLGMLRMLREAWLSPDAVVSNHHPRLVDLIEARDAEGADRLMRDHVHSARDLEIEAYRRRNR